MVVPMANSDKGCGYYNMDLENMEQIGRVETGLVRHPFF
jgi:hypothetical protein